MTYYSTTLSVSSGAIVFTAHAMGSLSQAGRRSPK